MAETNSTLVQASRYVAGGTTEVNSRAIEWWERTILDDNNDDREYVVEVSNVGRLDLIAASFLGEPRWWWVIAQYNNILDPYDEVKEGTILYIPTVERVKSIVSAGKLGGVSSKREVAPSILPIV